MKKNIVCIIDTDKIIGLLMTDPDKGVSCIVGWDNVKQGLAYFESAYNRNHRRSYEASMSACINAITFRPSIVELTMEELQALGESRTLKRVSNVSGTMLLLDLDRKKAKPIHEAGLVPRLIY